MSNPKGNPGNKGGGRKSCYDEYKSAEWAHDVWNNDQVLEILEKKIASGKFSLKDRYLLKAMKGSEKILTDLSGKMLADLHEHYQNIYEYTFTVGEEENQPVQPTPDAASDQE